VVLVRKISKDSKINIKVYFQLPSSCVIIIQSLMEFICDTVLFSVVFTWRYINTLSFIILYKRDIEVFCELWSCNKPYLLYKCFTLLFCIREISCSTVDLMTFCTWVFSWYSSEALYVFWYVYNVSFQILYNSWFINNPNPWTYVAWALVCNVKLTVGFAYSCASCDCSNKLRDFLNPIKNLDFKM
jgi:hypothetical protein